MEEQLLYFNACPRCASGTVEAIEGWDGRYFLCLNCGFVLEVAVTTKTGKQNSGAEDKNLESVA